MKPQNQDEYTADERVILAKHVTQLDRNVYCVKNLPEEVVAVLFAYVSRSPLSFRRNLLKLIGEGEIYVKNVTDVYGEDDAGYAAAKEKAMKFHDKWVVGYGHGSVAEHADIKFAIEDVSILFTKALEDNRLGRYTEKSTRYVEFDKQHYHKPRALLDDPELGKLYVETCDALFDLYEALLPKVRDYVRSRWPRPAEMPERPYEASVSAKAFDVVRYVLPASTYTMLGCSMNARAAEHAITKLLSHPLEEARAVGEQMLAEGRKICPTLLKHAGRSEYHAETRAAMDALAKEMIGRAPKKTGKPVTIVHFDPEAEEKLVAAMLYEQTELPYEELLLRVKGLGQEERKAVIQSYVAKKGKFDWPQRALESVTFTVDILMDYGAFRDLQRHRMNTQLNQRVTVAHGYEVPQEIAGAGLGPEFAAGMERARKAYETIAAKFPIEAQYVVPLAYRKRTLFVLNLRNLEHIVRLRSTPQGHISYRRIAQQLYDEVAARSPLLASLLTVDKTEHYLGRLDAELAAEKRRAALEKRQ